MRPLLLFPCVLMALFVCPTLRAQPLLDVMLSERMDKDTDIGRALGCDDEVFYTLRTVTEQGERSAFIDGWSRTTLTKLFTTPLQVPVVNAEVFSVHEVIVGDEGLQLFYSFYSKEDARRVLAMARFNQEGKIVGSATELIVEPATKEKQAREFLIDHNEESGMTLILNVKLYNPVDPRSEFESEMHVLTMDGAGNIKADQTISTGEWKRSWLKALSSDANGNAFLRFDCFSGGKGACNKIVVSVPAGEGKAAIWCMPELPKGLEYRDKHGFYVDPLGSVSYVAPFANPNQWETVSGYDLEGAVVQSFSVENGERTLDKIYRFKHNYPSKSSGKEDKVMKNSNLTNISFQPDGTLNFYGAESFAKVGSGGENSFWGLKLDLDAGFGKPWNCEAQRQYVIYPGQESLFNYAVFHLGGNDFLMANELRTNIGKPCSAMENWTKAGANGDKTVPAYACLSDNGAVGPRQRLGSDALGSTQYYRVLLEKRGVEYIIVITSDEGRYLARLRAVK